MGVLFAILLLCFASVVYSQTCSGSNAQVLILGGGMTGVSAANKLTELGITDFVILEAQDRLGGRMRTAEITPGVNVNVGANWIHGVDPANPRLHPVFDLAQRCGGLEGIYSDFTDIITYDSQGNEVNRDALRFSAYDAASEAASESSTTAQNRGDPDISQHEALTRAG